MSNNPNDLLTNEFQDKPKLPSGLNVLTILTFIGCAIQLFFDAYGYLKARQSFDNIDKLKDQMNSGQMPAWLKSMMGDPDNLVFIITKRYENRLPLLLLSIASVVLCFWGALQMRKLKKQGYPFYLIGELLPFLASFLFIGTISFAGTFFYIGVCFILLFILLYTLQRKYLVG